MKKDKQLYEDLTNQFFENAKEKNLSPTITSYAWFCISMQKSYSFCASHCLAYSIIGLQNMNLAYKYPIIFWNTANLIVDSSGVSEDEELDKDDELEYNEEEEDEEDDDEDEEVEVKEEIKRAKKTVNYGKIGSAIGKFRARGINILPPDVNSSSYTFAPDVESNSIIYGLRGIARISNDLIKQIIKNRPYVNFKDFMSKNKINKTQTINLIKSGAFDSIENKTREEILFSYIDSISDKKARLTLQNMQMLINYDLIPEDYQFYGKLFLFNKFLKKNKEDTYYKLNKSAINFISKYFDIDMVSEGIKLSQKVWDNTYKKAMEPMRVFLKENQKEVLENLNQKLFDEQKIKYAKGNISHWEMDSISYYYHDHELANANLPVTNYFELPEEPIVDYTFEIRGQEVKAYKLFLIAGAVIDKNRLKNSVTLLTPEGVVDVKIYKNQFSLFDKQLSEKDADGKKKVKEKSWFTRGNLLMIQGIRRGNSFVPKKRKDSVYPIISKITNVNEDGTVEFQFEREEVE